MDVLSRDARSALMSRIRSTDTQPELIVRRLLHRLGYRFRIHDRRLPGTPDIRTAEVSRGRVRTWVLLAPARRVSTCLYAEKPTLVLEEQVSSERTKGPTQSTSAALARMACIRRMAMRDR